MGSALIVCGDSNLHIYIQVTSVHTSEAFEATSK